MNDELSASEAQADLGAVLLRAQSGGRVVLTEGGRAVAAVIGIEDLARLEGSGVLDDIEAQLEGTATARLQDAEDTGEVPRSWRNIKDERGL